MATRPLYWKLCGTKRLLLGAACEPPFVMGGYPGESPIPEDVRDAWDSIPGDSMLA